MGIFSAVFYHLETVIDGIFYHMRYVDIKLHSTYGVLPKIAFVRARKSEKGIITPNPVNYPLDCIITRRNVSADLVRSGLIKIWDG